MTTYSIDDAHGNQLTTGFSREIEARESAQRLANHRGETVYLYSDESDRIEAIEPIADEGDS